MTSLKLEVVDIRKTNGDGNLKAFADLKLGGCLIIKGFSVMKGRRGMFVNMPRKQGKDGRWFDVLSPISEDFKREMEDLVLEAYDRETDGVSG